MPLFINHNSSGKANSDQFGNCNIASSTQQEDHAYGPSSTTNWFTGITPPLGGYTWYKFDGISKEPLIWVPNSDSELLSYYNIVEGTNYTESLQVKDAIDADDDQFLDGEPVRDGLEMFMDPNNDNSYSGTGTTVTNIAPSADSNNIDGTLDVSSMYVNPGGSNPAYFRVRSDSTIQRLEFDSTVSRAGNGDSTLMFYWWSDYNATGQYSNSQAFFGGKYTNYMALRGGGNGFYGTEAETNGGSEGNHDYFANETGVFTTGSWNSWVSVFDSGTASNYYNGVLNGTTYALNSTSVHSFVRLGSSSTGTTSNDRGGDIRMGALLLYNRVLTAAEIRYNLNLFDQRFR